MRIQITDEPTRKVVYALMWRHAQEQVDGHEWDGGLANLCFEHSFAEIAPELPTSGRDVDATARGLAYVLDLLEQTRALDRAMSHLDLEAGDVLEVPFGSAELDALVGGLCADLEENEPASARTIVAVARGLAATYAEPLTA